MKLATIGVPRVKKKFAMSRAVLCIGLSSLHLFSLHNSCLIVPMVAAEKVRNEEGPPDVRFVCSGLI